MSDLEIHVGFDDGVVLRLDGELDICSAGHLRSILDEVLAAAPARLVLELGGLSFMDSQGVAVLSRITTSARTAGTRLVARNPTRQVSMVMSVTGISQRLECHPPLATGALSN